MAAGTCSLCNTTHKNLGAHMNAKHGKVKTVIEEPASTLTPPGQNLSERLSVRNEVEPTPMAHMTREQRKNAFKAGGRQEIKDPTGKWHYRKVCIKDYGSGNTLNKFLTSYPDYQLVTYDEAKTFLSYVSSWNNYALVGGDVILAKCPMALYKERREFASEIGQERLQATRTVSKEPITQAGGQTLKDAIVPFEATPMRETVIEGSGESAHAQFVREQIGS